MPALRALFQKSNAPNTKPWSVVARAFMPSTSAWLNRSPSRAAPSSIEYSVWLCRWTKESLPVLVLTSCLFCCPVSILDPVFGQGLERVGQVRRIVAGELHPVPRPRVGETEPAGVQPLPGQPEVGGQLRVRAVGQVSGAGMVQGGKMHPDLVGAPGFQVHFHQR